MIEENVGETDRLLRLGFGAIAFFFGIGVLTLLGRAVVGGVLLFVGVILLGTAFARRCPIKEALDADTSDRD